MKEPENLEKERGQTESGDEREPANESRRVDFPEPEGPIMAIILPGSA